MLVISFFFFFNDTATTEIYTLSLHDALPICAQGRHRVHHVGERGARADAEGRDLRPALEDVFRRRGGEPRQAVTAGPTAYSFAWSAVWRGLPYLLQGAAFTVFVSALAMVVAVALGLVLAALTEARGGVARPLVRAYVEGFRNTPLLIQIFIVYFGLPQLGWRLSPFLSGLSALVIYAAAYNAEIFRAGLEAVPREIGRAHV